MHLFGYTFCSCIREFEARMTNLKFVGGVNLEIRYVLPDDDLQEISNVYEQSWKYAYKNIIPKSYLDSIPKGHWANNINRNGRNNIVMIENDSIIGTSSFCKSRWEKYCNYGEVVSIYFLPEYIGKGYGRDLLYRAIEELKSFGFEHVLLWVLEDNNIARKFYEKYGFIFSGEYRNDNIGGKELREVMYEYHIG